MDEIIYQLKSNAQYETTLEEIRSTKVLVIDEIGMLSMHIFESMEKICRELCGYSEIFGGLQVLGCGCFLAITSSTSNIDAGIYCFESKIFDLVFPHIIELTEVIRQKELDLITAINELCVGCPSEQTCNLIQ